MIDATHVIGLSNIVKSKSSFGNWVVYVDFKNDGVITQKTFFFWYRSDAAEFLQTTIANIP